MLLDLGITSELPSAEFARILKTADRGIFNCLWIGEDIDKPHDVFVQASHALMTTSLKVGTGITSIYFRNVSNIARAAACLSEIGRNRFRLGIGIGGAQVLTSMGIVPRKPLQTMRDTVMLLRRVWRGETITYETENFHLKSYYSRYGLGQKIPIYFGTRGPRMLELAGEVADGVILSGPKSYLRKAVAIVSKGARKTGRTRKEIKLVVWLPTVLALGDADLRLAKNVVAFVLADTPEGVLALSKLDQAATREIQEVYGEKGIGAAARLITDEMLNDMVFYGNAAELCKQFLELEDYGMDEVVFGPPFGKDRVDAIGHVTEAWRRNR